MQIGPIAGPDENTTAGLPDEKVATGFTINRHGRQWLVTARHNLDGISLSDVKLVGHQGPVALEVEGRLDVAEGIDVAVILLCREVTPNWPLEPSIEGAVLGQDA